MKWSIILSQITDKYKMSEMYFGNKDTTMARERIKIGLFIRFVPFFACVFGRRKGMLVKHI